MKKKHKKEKSVKVNEKLIKSWKEITITDIEWHESKNTPPGTPYYLNRPLDALINPSSLFRRFGLLFRPEKKEYIIYEPQAESNLST